MPLTIQPFAHLKELDAIRDELKINVAQPERVASVAGGAGLLALGLAQRGFSGLVLAVLGGLAIRRGISGHCDLYERLEINTARPHRERGVPGNKGINVEQTIRIARPPAELFRFWRDLSNLPRFMPHLESVKETGTKRSHWVVKGPVGSRVEWDAEIIAEHEGEMISWQSLPGATVQNAGSVWFEEAPGGTQTDLKVALQYQPPAGVVGAAVAKLFGEAPDQQVAADLQRFKELIENGSRENS